MEDRKVDLGYFFAEYGLIIAIVLLILVFIVASGHWRIKTLSAIVRGLKLAGAITLVLSTTALLLVFALELPQPLEIIGWLLSLISIDFNVVLPPFVIPGWLQTWILIATIASWIFYAVMIHVLDAFDTHFHAYFLRRILWRGEDNGGVSVANGHQASEEEQIKLLSGELILAFTKTHIRLGRFLSQISMILLTLVGILSVLYVFVDVLRWILAALPVIISFLIEVLPRYIGQLMEYLTSFSFGLLLKLLLNALLKLIFLALIVGIWYLLIRLFFFRGTWLIGKFLSNLVRREVVQHGTLLYATTDTLFVVTTWALNVLLQKSLWEARPFSLDRAEYKNIVMPQYRVTWSEELLLNRFLLTVMLQLPIGGGLPPEAQFLHVHPEFAQYINTRMREILMTKQLPGGPGPQNTEEVTSFPPLREE